MAKRAGGENQNGSRGVSERGDEAALKSASVLRPITGRFIAKDPIRLLGALNRQRAKSDPRIQ